MAMVELTAFPRVRPQVETGSEGKAWRSEVTAQDVIDGRHGPGEHGLLPTLV